MSTKQQIIDLAIEFILSKPQGVRYSELKNKLQSDFPESKAIEQYIWNLDKTHPDEVYKAARGLFRHTNFRDTSTEEAEEQSVVTTEEPSRIREEDFYQSFADWLRTDLEEVTKVIPLGGKRFGNKWGTPDVIGVYKSKPSHIIKGDPTIVSAEIKLGNTSNDLITAFGQACAYKLFSHKVYLVIPKSSSEISRIESLCLILGIGLILFDSTNKDYPKYEIKCRAMKHEPDIWYVNDTMPEVERELFV